MPSPDDRECACREISGELTDLVRWLSAGDLTPEEFRHTVAALEARKLQRFGFRLASAAVANGLAHFALRHVGTDELCASVDINPRTGEFEIQWACG